MKSFGRVLTAMVTPFHEDRSVNYQEAAKLARHLVANGSDGLVIAGTTGESPTLTFQEELKLFETVLDAVGDKAAVIAGTGSNDTSVAIAHTREAEKLGVHGTLQVGPYYNKPSQEGFFQHFKAIAESTSLPLILYNIPGRTGSNIMPATVARLAEISNIVAIKESTGVMDQVSEIARTTPNDFQIYSGDDSLTLPIMALGGVGIISVAAHVVGNQLREMTGAVVTGDLPRARAIHLQLMPFFKSIFVTTNPILIKTAVNLLGFNAGPLRLPLTLPTAEEKEQLVQVMKKLKLL
ncbi:MAG TPA: 4-hydroxy-tetrahydrodipicolinate synthase [Patescibacteria group bacterium]|nr:4-hydroxy-tetrahydrodipicolinate synthase [Patescibacteria group bacterium]